MRKILFFLILTVSVARAQVPCNSWLFLPSEPSSVKIGDLDITGHTITVECLANRTSFLSAGVITDGDLVAKHTGPPNVNYILRPTRAIISTTNGFYFTPDVCGIQLNKTYHFAMTYDGATLKFYRNGFLMAQTAATGDLIQNDLITGIGYFTAQTLHENFIGYINEVRIWDVARTQAQIRAYMNTPLPNPTTQPGLRAYYSFNSLTNLQGTAAWNGVLNGSASINAVNPNCNFVADSCPVLTPISNIINAYTPVTGWDKCKNIITVQDGTAFNTGDTVVIMQMKGAAIDSTNTASFGTITNYNNAGNYEFNYVKSRSGNAIELLNAVNRQYDIPDGKVQLIRVPYYNKANVTATLTCLSWDGSKGGVLVLNVQDSLILNADINVSSNGFKGGIDPFSNPAVFYCFENQYYYPQNPDLASGKGEGIAIISDAKSFGRGALSNGGGGGNSHNSGGGGGANAGTGGLGGYQYEGPPCDSQVPFDNRGIGGKPLTYSAALNKIFLGGGGGAGQSNNPQAFQATGGNGAGIVIIIADKIKSNSKKIIANGDPGTACGNTNTGCHEGMGGGGAGGAVLLNINNYLDNTVIENKGGKGGDMISTGNMRVGPGGGGGGGTVWASGASLPGNVTITNTGAANGVCTGYSNDPWGSTAGQTGITLNNLVMPLDNTPFKPNIDSVRIKDSLLTCMNFDFKGLGYTNTNPISNWQWYFGDGGSANTQNTTHSYSTAGTYLVKLIVTDINGCIDSVSKNVNAFKIDSVRFNNTRTGCKSMDFAGLAYAPGLPIGSWHWDFGDGGTASTQNATHNYQWSGNYTVKLVIAGNNNCTDSFTRTIQFIKLDSIKLNANHTTCFGFDFSGLAFSPLDVISSWQWDFGDGGTANTQNASHTYATINNFTVKLVVTDANGCKDSTTQVVSPGTYPADAGIDTVLCSNTSVSVTLHGMPNGAASYSWTPAVYLNNPNAQNPIATISSTTKFYLHTSDALGCSGIDSVTVTINPVPAISTLTDTAVCRGTTLILTTNGPGGLTWHWSPGIYVSDSTIASPRYIDNNSHTVYVNGTNAFGCTGKDTINVTIKPLPIVNTIPDSTICMNQSITLTTTGANSYSWSPINNLSDPNISNPVFNGNSSQQYFVTGTAANGCSSRDSVTITVITPGNFLAPPDKSTCAGTGVVLNGNNGNSVNYLWSPNSYLSNPTIINPVATPPSTINYRLLITESRCGYDSTFNVLVTVNPLPVINAGKSNDIDCSKRSAVLSASGGISYLWSPSNSLSSAVIPNPVATPATTQQYFVKVTTDKGCQGNDSVTVFNNSGLDILNYMPNAFVPGGFNNCYGLKFTAGIHDFQFMIYNRWGELMFMTNIPTACWDGTYKGKPADAGTYVFYLKATNFCASKETKGTFQLIR